MVICFLSQSGVSPMNSTMPYRKYRKLEGVDLFSEKRQDESCTVLEDLWAEILTQDESCTVLEDLPDEILTQILSHLNLKELVRTSVVSSRWRDLWKFTPVVLEFDGCYTDGANKDRKKFKAWVNHILNLHQAHVDGFIVRFYLDWPAGFMDKWINRALKKEARNIEINLLPMSNPAHRGYYALPSLQKSLHSYGAKSAFCFLTSLKLVGVGIHDDTLHYFLASSTSLECLTICGSRFTRSLRIVDPLPKLKHIEISHCNKMKSVEILVESIVSFTYDGAMINLFFNKTPKNLSALTLAGKFCQSFFLHAYKHLSYSFQLERLNLDFPNKHVKRPLRSLAFYKSPYLPQYLNLKCMEITASSIVGRNLLFCTKLIEMCPLLYKFRIKTERSIFIPDLSAAEASVFHHENLKLFELVGYLGCPSEEEFITLLLKIAPSLMTVTLDTENDFNELAWQCHFIEKKFDWVNGSKLPEFAYAKSRIEAKEFAERLQSKLPQKTQMVIL
ncbi:FBD-associated F-box protein At5g18780-like [Andrographis paniculata]|uniref:FBD-associated F-box protein At5g18780-like n=1 Tax=Andrographis paniculata TaxID=175694 RepID=UPI0021E80CAB|nr:FBD-associated F-box protein At5g18780-like [Andrographis paniculata]